MMGNVMTKDVYGDGSVVDYGLWSPWKFKQEGWVLLVFPNAQWIAKHIPAVGDLVEVEDRSWTVIGHRWKDATTVEMLVEKK